MGAISGERFTKRVWGAKHMLREPPAWALSKAVVEQIQAQGVREIIVNDLEDGRSYSASLSDFLRFGFPVQRGRFEPQLALPLARWAIDGAPVPAPGKCQGSEAVRQLAFAGMEAVA